MAYSGGYSKAYSNSGSFSMKSQGMSGRGYGSGGGYGSGAGYSEQETGGYGAGSGYAKQSSGGYTDLGYGSGSSYALSGLSKMSGGYSAEDDYDYPAGTGVRSQLGGRGEMGAGKGQMGGGRSQMRGGMMDKVDHGWAGDEGWDEGGMGSGQMGGGIGHMASGMGQSLMGGRKGMMSLMDSGKVPMGGGRSQMGIERGRGAMQNGRGRGGMSSDRGRGDPAVARGGMGMARGAGGRGSGGSMGLRGRGGASGAGRGGPGGFAGGRGASGAMGRGGGLSSLGDVVNLAKKRAVQQSEADLSVAIEEWQACLNDCQDMDPVRAMHQTLEVVGTPLLNIEFSCNFMCNVSNYELFTGVLFLNDNFLARGLGSTERSCRVDTYGKAYDLICNSWPDDLMSQEDPGEQILGEEVIRLYKADPRSFVQMLEKSAALAQNSDPMMGSMKGSLMGGPMMGGGRGQMAGGRGQMGGGMGQMGGGMGQMGGGRGQMAGGRGQMTGGRGQMAVGRGQMAVGRGQMAGGRSQMAGGRGLMAGGRGQMTSGRGQMGGGRGQMMGGGMKGAMMGGPGPMMGGMMGGPMKGPMKRPAAQPLMGPDSKRPRGPFQDPNQGQNPWPNSNALMPKKKVGILMSPNDPLRKKLMKLQQLLRDEGITKLHLVPKIDQIAHKTAINIKNVYRYSGIPQLGFETRTPVMMEIFFDNVLMASSEENNRRAAAMHNAYERLAETLSNETNVDMLASGSRYWHPHMENEPDVCHVVTKWQGDDNNSLLTTNLANMKQMMQSTPDFSIPLNKLILTEHEADQSSENVFKMLELSCTRNCMLLECEIVRDPQGTFTCTMSLQGKVIGKKQSDTKQGSKRLCSDIIMRRFLKNNTHIYVRKVYNGRTITKQELVDLARKLKAEGHAGIKNFMPAPVPESIKKDEPVGHHIIRKDDKKMVTIHSVVDMDGLEKKKENIQLKPLMPWFAAAFYKIIDEYYQKVTLEDLMVDIRDFSKSQFELITHCATRMDLRVISKLKPQAAAANSQQLSLLRRSLKASSIAKLLQLNGGKSGRYEMKKLVACTKSTEEELKKFRIDYLARHMTMMQNRDNPDIPTLMGKRPLAPPN